MAIGAVAGGLLHLALKGLAPRFSRVQSVLPHLTRWRVITAGVLVGCLWKKQKTLVRKFDCGLTIIHNPERVTIDVGSSKHFGIPEAVKADKGIDDRAQRARWDQYPKPQFRISMLHRPETNEFPLTAKVVHSHVFIPKQEEEKNLIWQGVVNKKIPVGVRDLEGEIQPGMTVYVYETFPELTITDSSPVQ